MDLLNPCRCCPRNCNINRHKETGYCKIKDKIKVARADLYFYEEPSISGTDGSGAIFFSNCNLNCLYCQNYKISEKCKGKTISITRLSEIMIELQNKKAHNINLVTPTMYIPMIKKAIIKAKKNGLNIPVIYNCSGYESVEALKELQGLIDIYMPDFKYIDNDIALKYSNCKNYVEYAKDSLKEMYRQVGKNNFDNTGKMTKGILVRHLILPDNINDSKKILEYLYNTYKNNIYISIMNQYTPVRTIKKYPILNKKITKDEYNKVIEYALKLGIENAYIQEDETVSESFIPTWDYTGIKKN